MNWKLLIVCLLFIVIGYFSFMGIQLWLSGNPFTIEGYITYVSTSTMSVVNNGVAFVQDKWQLVLTAVGSVVASIGGIYKLASNKIATIRQTAETQVGNAQSQATQQYVEMQGKITEQKDTITTLQAQVQDQATLTTKITDLEAEVKRLEGVAETQTQRALEAEKLAAEKYFPMIVCRSCQTSYPASLDNCPTCQTPQLIVK